MNWKPDFLWSLLLTVGVAAVGCSSGSVAESTSADSATTPVAGTDAADVTLVTLDLPGMT